MNAVGIPAEVMCREQNTCRPTRIILATITELPRIPLLLNSRVFYNMKAGDTCSNHYAPKIQTGDIHFKLGLLVLEETDPVQAG
jgi:hypothetical protein